MIENQTQLDADAQHQVETFGEISEPAEPTPIFKYDPHLADWREAE